MYDYIIVGAGIIGLSVAMQLSEKYRSKKILVIEKEHDISMHQTGRNSGVIHSGVYYKPNSFKASFSRKGNNSMYEFCEKEGVPFKKCGKLIVATREIELPLLEKLYDNGRKNDLSIKKMGGEEINEKEPHVCALKGVFLPSTGIVDYKKVADAYVNRMEKHGCELLLKTKVETVETYISHLLISTNQGNLKTKYLINCGGLYSDKIAEASGIKTDMKIIPFRGEYFKIKENKNHLVNGLIYPVPNPDFPFLGVHFTRDMEGNITIGPNAIPSLKREGYTKRDVNLKELYEIISYKPFWKTAFNNIHEGLDEVFKSFSKRKFLKEVNHFFPQLKEEDLIKAPAGVRAQALNTEGELVDDFLIVHADRAIHICNAPSPAATASLEIGQYIVELIAKQSKVI